jgi:hypothetical protein
MFIEIGAGFYNTEDIRWIQKWGGESITVAFKGESDANAMDVEFDNEEERDKEWDKIKSQIAYALIFQAPSDYKNPFYISNDNKGITPV